MQSVQRVLWRNDEPHAMPIATLWQLALSGARHLFTYIWIIREQLQSMAITKRTFDGQEERNDLPVGLLALCSYVYFVLVRKDCSRALHVLHVKAIRHVYCSTPTSNGFLSRNMVVFTTSLHFMEFYWRIKCKRRKTYTFTVRVSLPWCIAWYGHVVIFRRRDFRCHILNNKCVSNSTKLMKNVRRESIQICILCNCHGRNHILC